VFGPAIGSGEIIVFLDRSPDVPDTSQSLLKDDEITRLKMELTLRGFDDNIPFQKKALLFTIIAPIEPRHLFCPNRPLSDSSILDLLLG